MEEQPENIKLKSNFLSNQAKYEDDAGKKSSFLKLFAIVFAAAIIYGIYSFSVFLLNYDNIRARENVEITFKKPLVKDGQGYVNIEVANFNPAPIKQLLISCRVADFSDKTLKESSINLPGPIPAGDRRTFTDICLGEINGVPAKLSPKLDSLQYGPKPQLQDKYADQFIKAAALNDKESLSNYQELLQETDNFAPVHIGLGRAFAANGKLDEALSEYNKAIALDKTNANAHYYSAIALFYKHENEQAKKEIEQAAALAPEDPEIAFFDKMLLAKKEKEPEGKTKP